MISVETGQLLAALETERAQLHAYIVTKLAKRDYRAVADAAMDLREIDAKVSTLKEDLAR